MTKEKVLEAAGTVGKLAIRGAVNIGTNLAVLGGGLVGSLLLSNRFNNKTLQMLTFMGGMASTGLAAYFISDAVDDHLIEEYDLDIDGI